MLDGVPRLWWLTSGGEAGILSAAFRPSAAGGLWSPWRSLREHQPRRLARIESQRRVDGVGEVTPLAGGQRTAKLRRHARIVYCCAFSVPPFFGSGSGCAITS